jgi:enoyl-CoA hydratase/carnithine racemase
MDNASLESFRAFLLPFTQLCSLIRNFPKPTIAAINGVAVGGGFELTLVCDFRIAARSATIGSHEVNINQPMTNGSTYLLPRLIGEGRAWHRCRCPESRDRTWLAPTGSAVQ